MSGKEISRLYLKENLSAQKIAYIKGVSITPILRILKTCNVKLGGVYIRNKKKYIKSKIILDKNGCWNYPYSIQTNGYARIQGKYAHRVSYETFKRVIPEGLTIDHLCKNKICVNPDHMEPVTAVENVMRSNAIPAMNARKTHCLRGHLLSGDNLVIYAKKRQCRECFRVRNLKAYYKRRFK